MTSLPSILYTTIVILNKKEYRSQISILAVTLSVMIVFCGILACFTVSHDDFHGRSGNLHMILSGCGALALYVVSPETISAERATAALVSVLTVFSLVSAFSVPGGLSGPRAQGASLQKISIQLYKRHAVYLH